MFFSKILKYIPDSAPTGFPTVKHQRCSSRTCTVQKNHFFHGNTQYSINTLYLPRLHAYGEGRSPREKSFVFQKIGLLDAWRDLLSRFFLKWWGVLFQTKYISECITLLTRFNLANMYLQYTGRALCCKKFLEHSGTQTYHQVFFWHIFLLSLKKTVMKSDDN